MTENVDFMIEKFHDGFSHAEIARLLGVKKGYVTYTLNKNGFNRGKFISYKSCQLCDKTHNGKYVKYCNTCVSRIRRYKSKLKCVEYKGFKCENCGFTCREEEISALEFHHANDDKEFTLAKNMNRKWEYIKQELDKCILLCSNCHNIRHSKYDDEKLRKAVSEYNANYYK